MKQQNRLRVWAKGDRLSHVMPGAKDPGDVPCPVCITCGALMEWDWFTDPWCPDCEVKDD